ncbi:hypothetical protein [Sphingomonas sp. TX0522]|uniref:hypothetical protein n=1 Tax=Sphingomonas sp. TX0522 TaxID=2479205 RepID=UPI0018E06072|nr:hypothetical protein [Sphingomonas sp. TX0522]MBI0533023.1 hypothetical protein [Sphingomonas sp. TX0522]
MADSAKGEWLMRGHAKATIAYGDPVWAAQTAEMDRGQRARGDYVPPLPEREVDLLRGRQHRMEELRRSLVGQARRDRPDDVEAWVAVVERYDFEGEPLFGGDLVWMPRSLVEEFRTLAGTALPSSSDQERR